MKLFFLIFIYVTFFNYAHADSTFKFLNDFFSPGGRDRFLTNQIVYGLLVGDNQKVGIGNDMYSPDDLENVNPPIGDHPWSGYTYAFYQLKDYIEDTAVLKEARLYEVRLGVLGPASGTKALQTFIHRDLGLGDTPTWAGQHPSMPALDIIYSHKTDSLAHSWFGKTVLTQNFGFRAGNVVTEIFLDQKVTKILAEHFKGFMGIEGHIKAYDTHLEGRLLRSNIYTVNKEPFVAAARAGLAYTWEDFDIGFQYVFQTETFKGQQGNHLYGTFFIDRTW